MNGINIKFRFNLIGAFTLLGLSLFTGCQSRGEVFPQLATPVTWPINSETPRIEYVGKLTTASDLKAGKSWWKAFGEFVFGAPPANRLYGPRDVLVIDDTVIWVADPGGRCLHIFKIKERNYVRITQMPIDGGVTELSSPVGLCKGPNDTVFVCDSVNAEVYIFKSDGSFLRRFNVSEDIGRPTAACWVPGNRQLYILDTVNHDIKVYSLDEQLKVVIGKRGGDPGEFNFPVDLEYSNKTLWVVDAGNGRIQQFDLDGKHLKTIGKFGKSPGDFALPKSIAKDSHGNLYVTDARFENIQLFNPQGQLLMHMGSEGAGPGEFSLPSGLYITETDRIWVCDSYNNRLQVFQCLSEGTDHVNE